MDYKKLIKSRRTRSKILQVLAFIPDEPMLRLQYLIKTNRPLHLRNPKRFTEKLQWYKMHYRNPLMHQCVDKYHVREYVHEKGLDEILVKLYQYCESVDDIVWEELPQQFVVKTTHGSGGLNVVVCPDKNKLDIPEVKEKLRFVPGKVQSVGGREWAYNGIDKGVVVEELLVNEHNPEAGITDYKIFCYAGKPKYIVVDIDRYIGHKRNFYDTQWKNLHIGSDCLDIDGEIEKPKNFEKMLEIAEKLSAEFPFVRVDLYNVKGKIYFGELTFYPWSGYVQYSPDSADYLFGEDFVLKQF